MADVMLDATSPDELSLEDLGAGTQPTESKEPPVGAKPEPAAEEPQPETPDEPETDDEPKGFLDSLREELVQATGDQDEPPAVDTRADAERELAELRREREEEQKARLEEMAEKIASLSKPKEEPKLVGLEDPANLSVLSSVLAQHGLDEETSTAVSKALAAAVRYDREAHTSGADPRLDEIRQELEDFKQKAQLERQVLAYDQMVRGALNEASQLGGVEQELVDDYRERVKDSVLYRYFYLNHDTKTHGQVPSRLRSRENILDAVSALAQHLKNARSGLKPDGGAPDPVETSTSTSRSRTRKRQVKPDEEQEAQDQILDELREVAGISSYPFMQR